jgi:hypothetical protein
MADFEVLVPDGYEVVETDTVVTSDTEHISIHMFESIAQRHADQLNENRLGPLLRWVVEPTTKEMRKHFGISSLGRWAVIPYQNVLRRIDE